MKNGDFEAGYTAFNHSDIMCPEVIEGWDLKRDVDGLDNAIVSGTFNNAGQDEWNTFAFIKDIEDADMSGEGGDLITDDNYQYLRFQRYFWNGVSCPLNKGCFSAGREKSAADGCLRRKGGRNFQFLPGLVALGVLGQAQLQDQAHHEHTGGNSGGEAITASPDSRGRRSTAPFPPPAFPAPGSGPGCTPSAGGGTAPPGRGPPPA